MGFHLEYSPVLPYAFIGHSAFMAAHLLNSGSNNSMPVYIV